MFKEAYIAAVNSIKQYFMFSRSERNGILVLVSLHILAWMAKPLILHIEHRRVAAQWEADKASLEASPQFKKWKADGLADTLRPSQELHGSYPTHDTVIPFRDRQTTELSAKYKPKRFEINSADSAQLEEIKWIGESAAARIVKYRKRLGGFFSKEQYHEVWGIRDSSLHYLKAQTFIDTSKVIRLSLHGDSLPLFGAHPYIGWRLGKRIKAYSAEHPGCEPASLQQLPGMPDTTWAKISRYLVR